VKDDGEFARHGDDRFLHPTPTSDSNAQAFNGFQRPGPVNKTNAAS
jgi:hypothetical protein